MSKMIHEYFNLMITQQSHAHTHTNTYINTHIHTQTHTHTQTRKCGKEIKRE